MKYIITNHNKMAIGSSCYHKELQDAVSGQVIGAGEMRVKNGKVEVFGESIGYELKATDKDREFLQGFFN